MHIRTHKAVHECPQQVDTSLAILSFGHGGLRYIANSSVLRALQRQEQHMHVHTCMYLRRYMYVYTYIHGHTRIHRSASRSIRKHACIHIQTNIPVHMYTYIYTCTLASCKNLFCTPKNQQSEWIDGNPSDCHRSFSLHHTVLYTLKILVQGFPSPKRFCAFWSTRFSVLFVKTVTSSNMPRASYEKRLRHNMVTQQSRHKHTCCIPYRRQVKVRVILRSRLQSNFVANHFVDRFSFWFSRHGGWWSCEVVPRHPRGFGILPAMNARAGKRLRGIHTIQGALGVIHPGVIRSG